MLNNKYYSFVFTIFFATPLIMAMNIDKPGDIVYDKSNKQLAQVIDMDQICFQGKTTCRQKVLALVPLPGATVPCHMKLQERLVQPIDKDDAQCACNTYSIHYPLLGQMYKQLTAGKLVRTLICGPSGAGKNHLAYSFTQESGHPYTVVHIPTVFFGTSWRDSHYHEMRDIFRQAVESAKSSGKKVIAILDNVEIMDYPSGLEYRGQPEIPGARAIHEFFDRQDKGDEDARKVSIIAISNKPDMLSKQFIDRFFQSVMISLPTAAERHSAISRRLAKCQDNCDESVAQHMNDFIKITEGLNYFDLQSVIGNAAPRRPDQTSNLASPDSANNVKMTWPMLKEACQDRLNFISLCNPKPQKSFWSLLPVSGTTLLTIGTALIAVSLYLKHQ